MNITRRHVLAGTLAAPALLGLRGAGGGLTVQVYPNSSLMKTNAQFSAMRKGALDLSFYPLPYAGGEVQETNIGLMPGIIPSYEQAARWKTGEVGQLLTKLLEDKGIVMVSWIF